MEHIVIALLLMVNNEIQEARIQPSISQCLKGKRFAERLKKDHIQYKCIKSKAEIEKNVDGSISIKKLILN